MLPLHQLKAMLQEIDQILKILQDDLQTCDDITPPSYSNLPNRPGLYAIRYGGEILYLGKAARSIRRRFQGGHHTLVHILMSGIPGSELKIAIAIINNKSAEELAQIEARLLQQLHPPYNRQYPSIQD
jgi:excinuclease UvrABC nuclease subunit